MDRTFFLIGSLFGALSVALGAFGAHALRGRIEEGMLANYQTGVTYMFFHALALFVVVMALTRWPQSNLPASPAGSSSLASSSSPAASSSWPSPACVWLGAVTPIGGVAFIAGWVLLAWTAWRGS